MDEKDVLVQAGAVARVLEARGYETIQKACSLNLAAVASLLQKEHPAFVFNLAESIGGRGSLIHLVPSLLDALGVPYTGAGTEALFLSSNKLLAKKLLRSGDVGTPVWHTLREKPEKPFAAGRYIIKSVWEHASIGLDDDAVVQADQWAQLRDAIADRSMRLGGPLFAEVFIEGREFNLSLLAHDSGPEVLPPAEIRFDDYPPERPRMVGYEAKWIEDSFAYRHTPRCFDFDPVDEDLLNTLSETAKRCWRLFNLRGYARIDFRVDRTGGPWVLEVNSNPCLSPDAGFAAAAERRGLRFDEIIDRIVKDIPASRRKRNRIDPIMQAISRGKNTPYENSAGGDRAFMDLKEVRCRRDVRTSDRDDVREIVHSTGFFTPEEVDIALELVDETLARGRQSGYSFLFAEQAGRVLGYTCFGPIIGTAGSYDLYWIAVHGLYHRKGVGRLILGRSETLMAQEGCRRVYVETSSRSKYAPTRSFYERCGYDRVASLKDFYAPGDDKIVYCKTF